VQAGFGAAAAQRGSARLRARGAAPLSDQARRTIGGNFELCFTATIVSGDKRLHNVIDMECPGSWPADLVAYLDKHHSSLLEWESRSDGINSANAPGADDYDEIIYGLCDILSRYSLVGWHCTKLTDKEIANIVARGMDLPDLEMLKRRIDTVEADGLVTVAVGNRLRADNQADEKNRAGRIWFCFFPPHIGGESGIGRFFRSWGGEALYNTHEDDPETGPALQAFGTPCLIQARVAIGGFNSAVGLAFHVVRKFWLAADIRPLNPRTMRTTRGDRFQPATCCGWSNSPTGILWN
jgi:hypothetical protein